MKVARTVLRSVALGNECRLSDPTETERDIELIHKAWLEADILTRESDNSKIIVVCSFCDKKIRVVRLFVSTINIRPLKHYIAS